MYLKKSVVNTLVGIAMPATKNYSDFSDTIKKIGKGDELPITLSLTGGSGPARVWGHVKMYL
jgi:hypothetical protein